MKYSKKAISEARERLLKWCPEGSTVHTILRRCSRSGMSRCISIVIVDKDGGILHPNWAVAALLGEPIKRVCGSDAVRVTGCGMDMGFYLVYRLSHALYGDGDALGHRWL